MFWRKMNPKTPKLIFFCFLHNYKRSNLVYPLQKEYFSIPSFFNTTPFSLHFSKLFSIPTFFLPIECLIKGMKQWLYSIVYLSNSSSLSTRSDIFSQSSSSLFRVFCIVWLIVFSTSLHTSSIWFTHRLGCKVLFPMWGVYPELIFWWEFFRCVAKCCSISLLF